ncbi:hypothetical protein [Luteimonas lutimaris]|uniref:Uncharacterized protein n=1 Tax=Luteimonas lutimaris TaxID=698645 RepID=A0ABP7M2P3_9GAMM
MAVALQQAAVVGTPGQEQVETARESEDTAIRAKVVSDFEAMLREQPGLDEGGLEYLIGVFRETVQHAPIEAKLTPFDQDGMANTLNDLVESGAINEDERNSLARKFDEMLSPLDDKEVQVALEFARRCEADGEASALEWLEAQREAAAESKRATREAGAAPPSQEKERVLRRGYRTRGPPA